MTNNRKILIIGGGVSGLTAAHLLTRKNYDVTLIEKEDRVGGLARSFRYGGYTFDVGPHRFYSSSQKVVDYLKGVVHDFQEIERFSAVYFCDSYHTWPLRLKTVFQLPLSVSIPAFFDLFTKGRYKNMKDPSFKRFVLGKYGDTLYKRFFRDYTQKFLGLSPEEVHYHWAKIGVERATIDEKIKTGSIFQLFCLMLMPKPNQLNFLYPRGGCDVFCENLRSLVEEKGGEIITGAQPEIIEHDRRRISKIVAGGREYRADEIIWTAPLTDLFDLLGFPQPGLKYLNLVLFNIMLNEPPLKDYQWCYFGSRDRVFSRTTDPAQFAKNNVPQNEGALCVEVTSPTGCGHWNEPERLIDEVIDQLAGCGSISGKSAVKDVKTERVSNTYPIYDIGYVEKLNKVRKLLHPVSNLHLAGRTGLFWYNNMDHSIFNAMEVVERITVEGFDRETSRRADPFHLGAAVGDPCSVAGGS